MSSVFIKRQDKGIMDGDNAEMIYATINRITNARSSQCSFVSQEDYVNLCPVLHRDSFYIYKTTNVNLAERSGLRCHTSDPIISYNIMARDVIWSLMTKKEKSQPKNDHMKIKITGLFTSWRSNIKHSRNNNDFDVVQWNVGLHCDVIQCNIRLHCDVIHCNVRLHCDVKSHEYKDVYDIRSSYNFNSKRNMYSQRHTCINVYHYDPPITY